MIRKPDGITEGNWLFERVYLFAATILHIPSIGFPARDWHNYLAKYDVREITTKLEPHPLSVKTFETIHAEKP